MEGNLLLLQFSPEVTVACLALLRRPLCLPSQIREYLGFLSASQVALVVKNLPANAGDLRGTGSMIPRSGRSPEGGRGNPLQSSCLENPMDRGAWWAAVHGVVKSWTRLQFTASTFKVASSCYQITETNLCLWVKSYPARFRAAPIFSQGAQCKTRNSRHLLVSHLLAVGVRLATSCVSGSLL